MVGDMPRTTGREWNLSSTKVMELTTGTNAVYVIHVSIRILHFGGLGSCHPTGSLAAVVRDRRAKRRGTVPTKNLIVQMAESLSSTFQPSCQLNPYRVIGPGNSFQGHAKTRAHDKLHPHPF